MKNITKFGIIAGFFVIGAVFLFSNSAQASLSSGEAVASAEQVNGAKLYGQHCSNCHGADGRSQTPKGRELEADNIRGGISITKIINVVTHGKHDMPSFKNRLNSAQIKAIAGYVHGLR